ncbi:MAG: tetraacyldisaccharide 4'-kinase [Candidatus Marinimicrobia bacterium]|nr:tetraacyldisaccharide 4'-kinase [Candidatus Neomarinimicrobiota bacterium]
MIKILLLPFSMLYLGITKIRNFLYDRDLLPSEGLKVPVISVGNITAGGTGKTPFTIALANHLKEKGYKPVIITRGYKKMSKGQVIVSRGEGPLVSPEIGGDEPYLMARKTTAHVIADPNRYQAGLTAQQYDCNVIIADDAFQHRSLNRDVDIVLWDAAHNPKQAQPLPSGYLRESIKSVRRADFLIFSRTAEISQHHSHYFKKLAPEITQFPTPLVIKKLYTAADHKNVDFDTVRNRKVLAFCGLGNPDQFYKTIEKLQPEKIHFKAFADHYKYGQKDLEKLTKKAKQLNCDYLLTTEKDFTNFPAKYNPAPKILILEVTMQIDSALLKQILACFK